MTFSANRPFFRTKTSPLTEVSVFATRSTVTTIRASMSRFCPWTLPLRRGKFMLSWTLRASFRSMWRRRWPKNRRHTPVPVSTSHSCSAKNRPHFLRDAYSAFQLQRPGQQPQAVPQGRRASKRLSRAWSLTRPPSLLTCSAPASPRMHRSPVQLRKSRTLATVLLTSWGKKQTMAATVWQIKMTSSAIVLSLRKQARRSCKPRREGQRWGSPYSEALATARTRGTGQLICKDSNSLMDIGIHQCSLTHHLKTRSSKTPLKIQISALKTSR